MIQIYQTLIDLKDTTKINWFKKFIGSKTRGCKKIRLSDRLEATLHGGGAASPLHTLSSTSTIVSPRAKPLYEKLWQLHHIYIDIHNSIDKNIATLVD